MKSWYQQRRRFDWAIISLSSNPRKSTTNIIPPTLKFLSFRHFLWLDDVHGSPRLKKLDSATPAMDTQRSQSLRSMAARDTPFAPGLPTILSSSSGDQLTARGEFGRLLKNTSVDGWFPDTADKMQLLFSSSITRHGKIDWRIHGQHERVAWSHPWKRDPIRFPRISVLHSSL